MTMIQRAAMALANADNGAPTTWRMYVDDVRAVIAAMRDPTEAMLSAGSSGSNCGENPDPDDVWRAMIDAALEER